jgi:hypothetical protein
MDTESNITGILKDRGETRENLILQTPENIILFLLFIHKVTPMKYEKIYQLQDVYCTTNMLTW